MHGVPTELGFWSPGRGQVRVLVQGSRDLLGGIRHAQVVDGSTRLQLGRDGLIPTAMGEQLVHGGEMSVENSNVGPKNVEKLSSQNWVCLVWKMIPHRVASFCAHSRGPRGPKRPKSKFSWILGPPSPPRPIGCGGARKGLYTLVMFCICSG